MARAATRFSGWRIVFWSILAIVLTAPGQTIGVSVFIDEMIEGLDLTRSQVSGAYLVGTLTGATALPFVGRAIDRNGVRMMMTIVGLAFGVALAATGAVQGLITLALAFVGIRMLGQGSLSLVAQTAVALWFEHRRGFAIAIQMSVSAGLMSLAPLVLSQSVGTFGWRWAWVVSGLAIWLSVLPIARFAMIDRPADVGQLPDGGEVAEADRIEIAESATVAEAVRTPAFWSLGLMTALTSSLITGLTFHHISIMAGGGLSETEAATVFLPITVATVGMGFVFAWLTDRMSARLLLPASGVFLAIGLVLGTTVAPGLPSVGYGLLIGANAGAIRALSSALYPKWFGVENIGAIRGVATVIGVGASATGPLLISVGNDIGDSYDGVLLVSAAVTLVLAAVSMLAPVPSVRWKTSSPSTG